MAIPRARCALQYNLGGTTTQSAVTISIIDPVTGLELTEAAYLDAEADKEYRFEIDYTYFNNMVTAAYNRATSLSIELRVPGGGSALHSTTRNITANSHTFTINNVVFDSNPFTAGNSGSKRWGLYEVYVNQIRSGQVDNWNFDSRGNGTKPPIGVNNDNSTSETGAWARKAVLLGITASNVTPGGAVPSLWAYPDSIHYRATFDGENIESLIFTGVILTPGGSGINGTKNASSTSANKDFSWSASSERIDNDFAIGTYGLRIAISVATSTLGGSARRKCEFGTVPGGYTIGGSLNETATIAGVMPVDPTVTYSNFTVTQGAGSVINRGELISGTLTRVNARDEGYTPVGSDVVQIVRTDTNVAEVSTTVSRSGGVLTWSYTVPTSGGPNCPATVAGSVKAIRHSDSGSAAPAGPTADFTPAFALSSLFDVVPHLQVNNNALDPDLHQTTRLTSDLGFISMRVLNRRGQGKNTVPLLWRFRDDKDLVAERNSGSTVQTATVNGFDGFLPAITFDESLPGGGWDFWIDSTTFQGNTVQKTRQGLNASDFSLLAINPNLTIIVGMGPALTTDQPDHLSPGVPLLAGVAVYDSVARELQALDESPAPIVILGRFNLAIGLAQYLDVDYTWKSFDGINEAYEWPLDPSPADPKVFTAVFDTSTFGYHGLFALGKAAVGGTPYQNFIATEVLDNKTRHTTPSGFDPIAFALHGVIGQR